jgi:PAS domain S-box-containing protein
MGGTKILIVEDEGIEALDIQQRLVSLGYPLPEIALSGEEAMTKAKEICPDLVLMDIKLHGEMDGVTAAQQIRDRLGIPIIYLTAYADERTLQRAKITEPYGYIVKPFKERELHITIDMALYKHKMEKRLKESEKWFSTTLRSIGDAVIATDELGKIKFMNPVAEELTGWRFEEVKAKDLSMIFSIINRDSRQPVENPMTKVLREGFSVGLANHTILIARNGKEIPIDDSAAPIKDDKGQIIGAILVFRDITGRVQTEEALRKAYDELEVMVEERTADLQLSNEHLKEEIRQRNLAEDRLQEKNLELEKACRAKDRFLANMSHELRTPLTAIIGFTGTLLMRLPGPLTKEQDNQLQNIAASGTHLLSLINDLLDMAKIESGKVEIRPEPVSCQSVLQEVVATLRPMAEGKGISLTFQVPEHELVIKTDRRALTQILINLVNNAIKYTEKGEVRLDLKGGVVNGCQQIEFSVTDTGIGIKPEDQDKLFQAFSQVGDGSPYRYEGTGLGLHLSKKLADLLQGCIIFKSEYGRGSQFTLVLEERQGADLCRIS